MKVLCKFISGFIWWLVPYLGLKKVKSYYLDMLFCSLHKLLNQKSSEHSVFFFLLFFSFIHGKKHPVCHCHFLSFRTHHFLECEAYMFEMCWFLDFFNKKIKGLPNTIVYKSIIGMNDWAVKMPNCA